MKGIPERVRRLIEEVCDKHHVNVQRIVQRPESGRSTKRRTIVRREIWHRIRTEIIMANGRPPSYPQIGEWFGMDHTTIVLGVSKHRETELIGERVD